jgi:hypothetical protein
MQWGVRRERILPPPLPGNLDMGPGRPRLDKTPTAPEIDPRHIAAPTASRRPPPLHLWDPE